MKPEEFYELITRYTNEIDYSNDMPKINKDDIDLLKNLCDPSVLHEAYNSFRTMRGSLFRFHMTNLTAKLNQIKNGK